MPGTEEQADDRDPLESYLETPDYDICPGL